MWRAPNPRGAPVSPQGPPAAQVRSPGSPAPMRRGRAATVGRATTGRGGVGGGARGPALGAPGRRWPLERLLDAWDAAGMEGVEYRQMSLGGGIVMWGTKRA